MALKIIDRNSSSPEGLCKLVVEEDMTIYVIESMKQMITKMLDSYDCFELDLSGVEEIDTAGIQLLFALDNELKRTNKIFKLTAVSGAVTKLFNNYGVGECFPIGGVA